MDTKEKIIQSLKNILTENNMTIYTLAKITGINRSTLQKSFEGTRSLNLRQFKKLLSVLPISQQEKKNLYGKYVECTWTKKQLVENNCILEIINSISDKPTVMNMQCQGITDFKSLYSEQDIENILREITLQTLDKAEKSEQVPECYAYVPLYNDFFNSNISRYINNHKSNVNFSILFEFITNSKYNSEINLYTFKNILPLVLNAKKNYQLHYIYIEDFHYINHIAIYPYYIIFPDVAVLIDADLKNIILINDSEIIRFMINKHTHKLNAATKLNSINFDLQDCIQFLVNNQLEENDMYSIAYEPCISSFVPPAMYSELITDDFPDKSDFLKLIDTRISDIQSVPKKYTLFNKDSIIEFAKTGNLIAYKHPCLKVCTLEQRKYILENILNSMDDKNIIMRAFSSEEINLYRKFEITNVQKQYCINFYVYPDNNEVNVIKLINIYEPIISTCFINFIRDIIDTSTTFTYEETKDFIQQIINELETQIKNS